MNKKNFDSVEDVIADIAAGKMVIVTDDENRENEGDLIMAAEKVKPEDVNFMIRFARGLICAPTTSERLLELGIDDMVKINRDSKGTAFTVTVDAAKGITTGISAADRALTLKQIADKKKGVKDFVSPGHINPLRAKMGGVLERAGHTEAAVDLARLAGLHPSGVICEIINDDGTMARLPEIIEFKKKHNLKLLSVASLIEYRLRHDSLLKVISQTKLETKFGEFDFTIFRSEADKKVHYALSVGKIDSKDCYVRVHAQNLFVDLLNVKDSSNASKSFEKSMKLISQAKRGVLVCVSVDNWGIDLNSSKSVKPNMRDYGVGSQILRYLGLKKIHLLTTSLGAHNLPDGYGLEIVSETKI